MSKGTPEDLLKSIVDGINTGNLDALMPLYEPEAGFVVQPGSVTSGLTGVREGLAGFIAMKGKLDLKVTRILEASYWVNRNSMRLKPMVCAPESANSQRGESPLQVNALRPVTECNCDAAMRGGEQQEVNNQSVG